IDILLSEGVIDLAQADDAKAQALGVVARPGRVDGASPAFMDEVRAQLRRDYAPEDLNTVGLRVFTTLDPFVQARAEAICAEQLAHVERDTGTEPDTLQVGAVISDPQGGELLAAVGGRQPGFAGYNRAITLRRSIGSLAKPFVYLAALATDRYDLSTVVSNDPLQVTLQNGDVWAPTNYTDVELGDMPVYRALAESINRPAVHVGLDVGIDAVARQFEAALPDLEIPRYASITLGALNLSPRQVAEMYATLATGGDATPLRAVREVIDAQGLPLKRYELRLRASADTADVVQVVGGMQVVMQRGTGRRAGAILPADMNVAGKSGSTNDYRDAWFAGFSADRLAVVWVGRDDNAPTGLSGARAALPIWAQLMRATAQVPYQLPHSDEIQMQTLDYTSGMLADAGCDDTVLVPLPRDAELPPPAPCAGTSDRPGIKDTIEDRLLPWLRDRFTRD
ncbi:MAG: penicillin-binding transpeptidase domain-containing protein, partial [Pseudomonadota bacterium]